jgi:hypothetical protein
VTPANKKEQMMTCNADLDIWIRLPSRGREMRTGLTRGYIYGLIKDGKIKSSSIRQPGRLKGVRLVWLPSLLEFIERHAESTD